MTHPSQESEMRTKHSEADCFDCLLNPGLCDKHRDAAIAQTPESDDKPLRRDVDRWLDDGMTADQYDAFRMHVGRIREQAATETRRELLAKVEGLRRGDNDYIYGRRDPEFCETWNAAIDGVRELLEEPR